jgi:hypothetical protein
MGRCHNGGIEQGADRPMYRLGLVAGSAAQASADRVAIGRAATAQQNLHEGRIGKAARVPALMATERVMFRPAPVRAANPPAARGVVRFISSG